MDSMCFTAFLKTQLNTGTRGKGSIGVAGDIGDISRDLS